MSNILETPAPNPASGAPPQAATQPRVGLTRWRAASCLVPLIYLLCLLAFLADLRQDNTLAFGVFYIPLVASAVFHRSPRAVWWLAGIACVFCILGGFFPDVNPDLPDLIGNRAISLVAILATAIFLQYARTIQDQLTEQRRRAEAAEAVRTQVFTNLSQEIRTPLHAMIALLEVMMPSCRPDQRLPLEQVQGAGRRLLATIENLIDLTGVDSHPIRPQRADLGHLLREVTDANRRGAAEQQVVLELDVPAGMAFPAELDPWATRRILDNLLANAVKYSRPGSSVQIWLEPSDGALSVMVQDAGVGMDTDVLQSLGEPFFQAMTQSGTGTGLALSRRLADSMGATLRFASERGVGTTATLRVRASPAAET